MRKRRFVLVSCSGPDGSGKTTLARNAIANLRAEGVDARYHWMRLGSSRFLDLAKKLAPVRGDPRGDASGGGYKEVLTRHSRLRRVWVWVLVADYLARVWAKVLRARLTGGVHVVDRYAVDAAVDLSVVYGFAGGRRLLRLAPTPRLRVIVTASGVDLSRRGDTPADPAVLARSLALYEEWGAYFTHRIDAASSPDEVAGELTSLILEAAAGS